MGEASEWLDLNPTVHTRCARGWLDRFKERGRFDLNRTAHKPRAIGWLKSEPGMVWVQPGEGVWARVRLKPKQDLDLGFEF